MRIFIAGATGVIGVRLVPLLVAEGHDVAGMTRSPEKAEALRALGAEPVVCDVFDPSGLTRAMIEFMPELVMHQVTDLPDQVEQIPAFAERNNRVRTEGTRNLIAAAKSAEAQRFLAQSICWEPPAGGETLEEHEEQVLNVGGVVIQYGQLYGPGTYHEQDVPPPPRIHVDAAARRTVELLDAAPGVIVVAEPDEP